MGTANKLDKTELEPDDKDIWSPCFKQSITQYELEKYCQGKELLEDIKIQLARFEFDVSTAWKKFQENYFAQAGQEEEKLGAAGCAFQKFLDTERAKQLEQEVKQLNKKVQQLNQLMSGSFFFSQTKSIRPMPYFRLRNIINRVCFQLEG